LGKNSRRLDFLRKITTLLIIAERHGIDLVCTCFDRSAAEQFECYQKGRTAPGKIVTNCDGYKKRSAHQDWEAWDILIIKDGEPVWPRTKEYEALGEIWKKVFDGIWGGDWEDLNDIYHFQLGD